MTPDLVSPAVWAAEGRRTAGALEDMAAAIVTGRDADAAAAVALGIASAVGTRRRVAVADLVGGLAALTPLADQPGLLECLRDGEPVSGIGRALPGSESVYVLPSGRGPIAERWVFESARWERLIAGFREVDALLLLVAPPGAPGLEALVARVDGVVAVDLPPRDVRAWPLIATVDHPEPELPVLTSKRTPTGPDGVPLVPMARRARRRWGRWVLLGAAVGGALAGAAVLDSADEPTAAPAAVAAPAPTPPAPVEVEVALGPLVNPADSMVAARFAVEVVAANTLASANSRLASPLVPYPAPTVAPVVLRAGSAPWYRALVGAWQERADADRWLAEQRDLGLLRREAGRVVAVPYALVLAEVRGPDVPATLARWERAGIRAYGLVQLDGSVRIYAGAFETAGQAAWLASTAREAGADPRLAYRTGRAF